MAAAAVPAASLRSKSCLTLRFLSFCSKIPTKPRAFPPLPRGHFPFSSAIPRRRCFSSVIARAVHSGETTKMEALEKKGSEMASKVGEFRKKLKVADIKGGADEGLNRVGQTLVVAGWVRTLRAQSSITFIEVTLVAKSILDIVILFSELVCYG